MSQKELQLFDAITQEPVEHLNIGDVITFGPLGQVAEEDWVVDSATESAYDLENEMHQHQCVKEESPRHFRACNVDVPTRAPASQQGTDGFWLYDQDDDQYDGYDQYDEENEDENDIGFDGLPGLIGTLSSSSSPDCHSISDMIDCAETQGCHPDPDPESERCWTEAEFWQHYRPASEITSLPEYQEVLRKLEEQERAKPPPTRWQKWMARLGF